MIKALTVCLPFLMCATLIRAAISQGIKIQAIMQGVEPQTDWILIGLSVVTVVVLGIVVAKYED